MRYQWNSWQEFNRSRSWISWQIRFMSMQKVHYLCSQDACNIFVMIACCIQILCSFLQHNDNDRFYSLPATSYILSINILSGLTMTWLPISDVNGELCLLLFSRESLESWAVSICSLNQYQVHPNLFVKNSHISLGLMKQNN